MMTAAIHRLHQLAWQPGLWMHTDWWVALDLLPWQAVYQQYTSSRPTIDALIAERRQFPVAALPSVLDEDPLLLLNNEGRFIQLATILGLIVLGERESLFIGSRRRVLSSVLSLPICDQLLLLNLNWRSPSATQWDGEDTCFLARVGCQWLAAYPHSPVLTALLIRLPRFHDGAGIEGADISFKEAPLPVLHKLLRFL